MKNVVCLGGGNAMPKALLSELKKVENINLTVISAMLDSGGSSGRLRKELDTVAPGDIRRAFLELSLLDKEIKDKLNYRFEKGELKGHNLGNLIIAGFNFDIDKLNSFFKTSGRVLPITLEKANLCAELLNGEIIKGETNIDVPKHNSKIKKVYLDRKVNIYKEASEAILNADFIIIGPGDLYSSLIQILLTKGIKEAIKKSKAKIIYIVNIKTKKGETDDFKVEDFVKEIEKYLEKEVDYIIYNNKNSFLQFQKHEEERYIGADLLCKNDFIHDPKKLINKIFEII